MTPAKTPVAVPRNAEGSMPARSKASQQISSMIRCWGSMASASLGPMPKNPASKSPACCRKLPCRVYILPLASGSGSYNPSTSQPRSTGKSDTVSRPSITRSHNASGESTPPA